MFDQARRAWDAGDDAAAPTLQHALDRLRSKTEDLPISPVRRIWSKHAVESET